MAVLLIAGAVAAFITSSSNGRFGATTRFSGVTVGADGLIVNGPTTFSATTTAGSVARTYLSGSFADATTTIFAVQNPFLATSTVSLSELFVTGASTSTIAISVATSTNQYPTSVSAGSLINSASFATSTLGQVVNGATAGSTGFVSAGTNSQQRIILGPNDYIVGFVTGSITTGVTGTDNTFAGSYRLEIFR